MQIIPGCDILLIFCLHHVGRESLIKRYKYNYWNNIGPSSEICPQTRMRGLTVYSSIYFLHVKETRLKHFWVASHDTSPKMNRENNSSLIFQKVDSHAPETDDFCTDKYIFLHRFWHVK